MGSAPSYLEGMMEITIHGHTVELTDPDEHDIVVDVVVLCRAIHVPPSGRTEDSLLMDATPHTTLMVQRGMLDAADIATSMGYGEDA